VSENADLGTLEREAYRASWSDGIIDLFAGLSLIWIGAAWIWLSDLAGLAGILPAVFVAPVLSARKRFVEPRIGYVQWRGPRRRWERHAQWAVLLAGVGVFVLGIALYVYKSGAGGDTAVNLAPGILAWLLAVFAGALALLTSVWRMLLYAAVLFVAGFAVVAAQANPGWALLAGGLTATVVGVVLLRHFVHRYPPVERS
jgi:hypothetical protein